MAGFEPCNGFVDARDLLWGTEGVTPNLGMAIGPISSPTSCTAVSPREARAPQPAERPCMEGEGGGEGVVSLTAVVPEALLVSMRSFIEDHPNWDQYRLVQAALAGFLVQNGLENRAVTRYYLANLFPSQSSFQDPNNC